MRIRKANFFYLIFLISSCSFLEPEFKETKITKAGDSQSVVVLPHKDDNNVIIIRYESMTNSNYQLKVEFYAFKDRPYNTAFINVSNGTVNGEWRRDFYGNRANGKVIVTYIPENPTANGEVSLLTSIE